MEKNVRETNGSEDKQNVYIFADLNSKTSIIRLNGTTLTQN